MSRLLNGALYIDTGIEEPFGNKALYVVCWCHEKENVLKKIGIKREKVRIFLRMTYAQDKKTLARRTAAKAERDVEILAAKSLKKNDQELFQKCSNSIEGILTWNSHKLI